MSLRQSGQKTLLYSALLADLTAEGIDEISWGPATATGTPVLVRQGDAWRAFLVSDLTASAKASSTHSHLGLLAGSNSNAGFSTSSVTYVDIVTPFTVTVPANFPGGFVVLQFLMLASVQCSVSAGTYDIQIGDSTVGTFNSFSAMNNTDSVVQGLLTNINELTPSLGAHTFNVQARVSNVANLLTVPNVQAAVYGYMTQGPLSGT